MRYVQSEQRRVGTTRSYHVKWILTKNSEKERYNRVRDKISNTSPCLEARTAERIINDKQRITDPTIVSVSTGRESYLPEQLLDVTLARSNILVHKNSTPPW